MHDVRLFCNYSDDESSDLGFFGGGSFNPLSSLLGPLNIKEKLWDFYSKLFDESPSARSQWTFQELRQFKVQPVRWYRRRKIIK